MPKSSKPSLVLDAALFIIEAVLQAQTYTYACNVVSMKNKADSPETKESTFKHSWRSLESARL